MVKHKIKTIAVRLYKEDEDIIDIIEKYKTVFKIKSNNDAIKKIVRLNQK